MSVSFGGHLCPTSHKSRTRQNGEVWHKAGVVKKPWRGFPSTSVAIKEVKQFHEEGEGEQDDDVSEDEREAEMQWPPLWGVRCTR